MLQVTSESLISLIYLFLDDTVNLGSHDHGWRRLGMDNCNMLLAPVDRRSVPENANRVEFDPCFDGDP